MEYGIWGLHAARRLWGDPRIAPGQPILPPGAMPQTFPRALLALTSLRHYYYQFNRPDEAEDSPYEAMELTAKTSSTTDEIRSETDVPLDESEQSDDTEKTIEKDENDEDDNQDFAVNPMLHNWILSVYSAMLGRLSAVTAALEATEVPSLPSDSDSETSDQSSYKEKSRDNSPVAGAHHGYPCSSCEVVSTTRPALKKHILDCHPASSSSFEINETGNNRICPSIDCNFNSTSRCEMETHAATHAAQGIVSTGKKRTLALQRIRYRYEREEYRCSLCSYACTIEKAFQRHLRAHAKGAAPETRVSCAVCGADRSSEVDLSRHMRRHRDDRYFCCDICVFRTVQLKKLIQHRRMHTGEKPHLCPHCAYRSARRDNLRSHVRRVHKKENLYCDTFSPRGMLISSTVRDDSTPNFLHTTVTSPANTDVAH